MKKDRSHLYVAVVLWVISVLVAIVFNWQLAFGATARLVWDHDGGVDGYRLYMGESGQPMTQVWQGPEKTTALDLTEGVTYQFAVTAYTGRLESAQSDILQFTAYPAQQTIVVPGRPSAIRIEFLND